MDLTAILIVATVFYALYAIIARFATRRERLKYLENLASMTPEQLATYKDMNPNWEVMVKKDPATTLRNACLLVGIGLGMILAWVVYGVLCQNAWSTHDEIYAFLLLAFPLFFGGVGLLTAFLIDRKNNK